jgi:tRNA wybutosine-synthesizing protein 2
VRHRESGLVFAFDVAKTMFSSGNIEERARLARMNLAGETVFDLFAGIGYFAVPLAAGSGASRVFACEKNPDAFAFLLENVRLNRVEQKVVPLLGDCRRTAPSGVAHRVVMGYVGGTENFLRTALASLRPEGGVVHFHEAYPQEIKFEEARRALRRAASGTWRLRVLGQREVKSFAPGIDHIVVDAEFRPRATRLPSSG